MPKAEPYVTIYRASFTQRNPIFSAAPRSGTVELSQRPPGSSLSAAEKDYPRTIYHGSSRVGGTSFRSLNTRRNSAKAPFPGGLTSSTNSHTLPDRFTAPQGLAPSGRSETGSSLPLPTLARDVSGSLPQGYNLPSMPRAAFSHSRPLGSRLPAHCANARASGIKTFTTG